MSTFIINIPKINGEIEIGIDEAPLPDNKKLPILYKNGNPASVDLVKTNAAAWALNQFNETPKDYLRDVKRLFVNGVCACIDLGLVRHIKNVPTGEWQRTDTIIPITEQIKSELTGLITLEDMRKATTIIVASKANFWTMNQHTGQGAVPNYVQKALKELFPHSRDYLTQAAYTLGRYASTLVILKGAGIPNIRDDEAIVQSPGAFIKLSSDAKLQFSSLPAGTLRLAIAYDGANRIIRSKYARICPAIADFKNLPVLLKAVMSNPSKYHTNAEYLTGVKRADYTDSDNERFLGRVGIFITTLHPKCTLANTPYLRLDRIQNYNDYDIEFNNALAKMHAQAMRCENALAEGDANLKIIEQLRHDFCFVRSLVADP